MDTSRLHKFLHTRIGILTAIVFITVVPFLFRFLIPGEAGDVAIFLTATVLLFTYAALRRTGLAEFGLQRPESWKRTILLGILYAVIAFVLFRITLEPLLERWTGVPRDMSRFEFLRDNPGGLLKFLAIIWITAAFFEELYFRGFLIPSIAGIFKNSRAGWIIAVVLSTLFFAMAHSYQAISGVLYTGLAALFLAVIFLAHGKNLWIVMIAHGLHDTSGAYFTYLGIYKKIVHWLF